MEKTTSRFYELKGRIALNSAGKPKNGQELKVIRNMWGQESIFCIFNWKDGFLHSEDDTPAVQMSDTHTEYWTNGKIDNNRRDVNNELMPAVISDYGRIREYWINGTRIK